MRVKRKYILKFFFYLILHLGNHLPLSAQNKAKIDSLENKLATKFTHDTIKINTMIELVRELYSTNPPKAKEYAEIGITLSQKINFRRGEVRLLYYLGMIAYYEGSSEKSIDYFLKSLAISEKENDNEMTGANLTRIGNINREEENYKIAYESIIKGVNILKKVPNKTFLISGLYHLGLWYLYQNKYKEALNSFEEALLYSRAINDERLIAISYYYLAEVYLKQNDHTKSLDYYQQSAQLNKKINNLLLLGGTFNNMAKIFIKLNQINDAIYYSQRALEISQKISQKAEIADACNNLYTTYKIKNQIDSAFKYQSLWIAVKDSLFNEKKNKQIYLLQYNAQKEKDKIEIEKQKAEITQKDILLYASVIVIAFILIIIFILYRSNKIKALSNVELQRQKVEIKDKNQEIVARNEELHLQQEELKIINENLEEKNQEIETQNEELSLQKRQIEMLNDNLENLVSQRTIELKHALDNLTKQNQDLQQFSYIISHNLRSPVARVLGLLSLFNKENYEDNFNKEIITYLEQTTANLDTVIKDLSQIISIRNDLNKTKEEINILEIIEQQKFLLKDEIETSKAIIDTQQVNEKTLFSIKSYVQSILHNLLSNAIKYKSNKRTPLIIIKTQLIDNFFYLSVQDNGIGIDMNNVDIYKIFGLYQRMHDHVEGKGLGLFLVKTQIESLSGKIEVESQLNVGTTFRVYFPLN